MRCFVWISKVGHFSVPGKDKESKVVGIKPRNKIFIDRVFKASRSRYSTATGGKLPYTTLRVVIERM
jgi:hypothetical protein